MKYSLNSKVSLKLVDFIGELIKWSNFLVIRCASCRSKSSAALFEKPTARFVNARVRSVRFVGLVLLTSSLLLEFPFALS